MTMEIVSELQWEGTRLHQCCRAHISAVLLNNNGSAIVVRSSCLLWRSSDAARLHARVRARSSYSRTKVELSTCTYFKVR